MVTGAAGNPQQMSPHQRRSSAACVPVAPRPFSSSCSLAQQQQLRPLMSSSSVDGGRRQRQDEAADCNIFLVTSRIIIGSA